MIEREPRIGSCWSVNNTGGQHRPFNMNAPMTTTLLPQSRTEMRGWPLARATMSKGLHTKMKNTQSSPADRRIARCDEPILEEADLVHGDSTTLITEAGELRASGRNKLDGRLKRTWLGVLARAAIWPARRETEIVHVTRHP